MLQGAPSRVAHMRFKQLLTVLAGEPGAKSCVKRSIGIYVLIT